MGYRAKWPILVLLAAVACGGAAAQAAAGGAKPQVAVLDLDAKGVSADDAKVVSELLRSKLIVSGAFVVLERKNVDRLLGELELQASGLVDASGAAEVGGLLGADYVLAGTLMRLGPSLGVALNLVRVETAEIVASAEASVPSFDAIYAALDKLSAALIRSSLGLRDFTFSTQTQGFGLELGAVGSLLFFRNPDYPAYDGLKAGGGLCLGFSVQDGNRGGGFYSLWSATNMRAAEYLGQYDWASSTWGDALVLLPCSGSGYLFFGDKTEGLAYQFGFGGGYDFTGGAVLAPMVGLFLRNWYARLYPTFCVKIGYENHPQYAIQLEIGRSFFFGTHAKPVTPFD